jgi:hypothetical protein
MIRTTGTSGTVSPTGRASAVLAWAAAGRCNLVASPQPPIGKSANAGAASHGSQTGSGREGSGGGEVGVASGGIPGK